jgi:2-keto-4-pentenoate hydratase
MQSSEVYVRQGLSPAAAERFHMDPSCAAPNLEDAYCRVRNVTSRDPLFGAAWKLGGTTAITRTAFDVDTVYFGCLHAREVVHQPTTLSVGHLCETKGEAEIAVRLSNNIRKMDIENLRRLRGSDPRLRNTLIDAWCLALEMPASAILNLPDAGVTALVADRCAAGCLILGPEQSVPSDPWIDRQLIALEQEGTVIARGDVAALIAPPIDCTIDFCLEALRHGFDLRPSQWVSTGGLTPCASLARNGNIMLRLGDTVMLQFELRG